ncbi:energy transducer TonB [Parasphingorhabdus cellanae]|uniref:Energy transducer TonB n=2 Tax=Parasphingorhabdus cellanae TaxID=2806553 RepID=A0ABX7TAQ5_9SPHN|nr:energy transducer TonB [Parasphingorhabdus cellanae]
MRNGDYPHKALREERKGSVALLLTITRMGRVGACEVTQSSGHDDLDQAACKNLSRRARFVPAMDYYGKRDEGFYPLSVNFAGPPWIELQRAQEKGIQWEPPLAFPEGKPSE